MSKVSIRQPIVLYALVFVFLASAASVTVASIALVHGARRAYRRASVVALDSLLGSRGSAEVSRLLMTRDLASDLDIGIVTPTTSYFGFDLVRARTFTLREQRDLDIIIVRLRAPDEEAYAIARIDASVPMSIAAVEISRMVPLILVGTIAIAALLAFMISRLLLPSLDVLAEIAAETGPDPTTDLPPSETPNEILEVAQRFRRTVRHLNDERDRIEAQKDEMARMQESLVRASKLASVGRLAAGVAHEIGNPLAAVRGYLSLLKSGLSEEQSQDVLDRSTKELGRINETIKKLLVYARKGEESGETVVPFSSSEVIDEVVALVSGHPSLTNVTIACTDLPSDTKVADVVGHAGRLNQVFVNLLLNAAHAMKDSEPKRIEILRVESSENISYAVIDTGPGISPDQERAIFDPFFTTKSPGEGTGLGLAVSRALMEAMQGDLSLDTEHEGGARFVIRLPRHEET